MAEGDRQGPHHLRRQESAPELPGRRRALLDQPRRGQRHQRRAAGHRGPAVRATRRTFVEQVYIPDLLADRRRSTRTGAPSAAACENYLCLRRPADQRLRRPDQLQVPARRHPQPQPERGAPGRPRKDPQEIQEFIAHSWYEYSGGDGAGLHPWEGETKLNYTGPEAALRAPRTWSRSTAG